MAICSAPLNTSFSAGGSGSQLKKSRLLLPSPVVRRNSIQFPSNRRNLCVRAEYSDDSGGGGGGVDHFLTGFLVGGAVFGTLAYVFAPQIRSTLLDENPSGFRRARKPVYYDGYYDEDESGLAKTRQTLNEKISQLNSAIDNVSSRLKGGPLNEKISQLNSAIDNVSSRFRGEKSVHPHPTRIEDDPEVGAFI